MAIDLQKLLGDEADSLLRHEAKAFPADGLVLPGPDFLDRVFRDSDRSPTVLRNLGTLYGHGRLGGTGYLSILPVDQGIEHSAGASFAKNPRYFDPGELVRAGAGRRVQRDRDDARRPRRGLAALRPPDPVHRQAQPQRLPALPEHVRPGPVRHRAAGVRPRRGRRRRDDLLRLGRERPAAARGLGHVRRGARARHVHRPVVLPAKPGVQEGRRRLPPLRRPDRPGQPHGRNHRGGHHQAEAGREQRRLQRRSSSARPTRSSTTS